MSDRVCSSNSRFFGDALLVSVDEHLFVERPEGRALLRSFAGASRGLRTIFATSNGSILVAPEGRNLPGEMKGLWRCRGGEWHRVLDLSALKNPVTMWGVTQHPAGRLFAAIYSNAPDQHAARIYRSDDDGGQWVESYYDPSGRHVHDVCADPWTGAVYATVGDDFKPWRTRRVIRSRDCGETWEEILAAMPQVAPIMAVPGARIFGSDDRGRVRIFRTFDDVEFETVLEDDCEGFVFWLRRDRATAQVFAGTVASTAAPAVAGVYRSADNGRTWHRSLDLPAERKWDGSQAASDIAGGKLMVSVARNGEPSEARSIDTRRLHPPSTFREAAERAVAMILLLVASPVLAIAAIATKLTNPGPAFFVQERHGRFGRIFRILKVRTTVGKAVDHESRRVFTRIGRIARALSIDELPQLWNVLRGDMSFVGPRPHPPALDLEYCGEIENLMQRYEVRPGITGLAQVSGSRGPIRSADDMRRRVEFDVLYVKERSMIMDIAILARTLLGGFIDRTALSNAGPLTARQQHD